MANKAHTLWRLFGRGIAYGICLLLVCGAGAGAFVLISHRNRSDRAQPSASRIARFELRSTPVPAGDAYTPSELAGGSARQRLSLGQVIEGFADSYGRYLDGAGARQLADASITAEAQVRQGGRVPVALRDGAVTVAGYSAFARSCCSAQETVVLANRQERYPFTLDLLYEQNAWQVATITPVDLGIADGTHPVAHVVTPAGARSAAATFAVAYANLKDGSNSTQPAMSAGARAAIAGGTDSLAGFALPRAAAHLRSLAFGPQNEGELAATATVTIAGAAHTFSYLMVNTRGGWICEAFL
jgi:hypothetical protein